MYSMCLASCQYCDPPLTYSVEFSAVSDVSKFTACQGPPVIEPPSPPSANDATTTCATVTTQLFIMLTTALFLIV
jgi:hypothetical protein